MSKSLGNVVEPGRADPEATASTRPATSCCARSPFGNDGDFSHAAMVRRINHDLANDYGNLAQRVLSMIAAQLRRHGAGARPA